jgi:hypothetical protein
MPWLCLPLLLNLGACKRQDGGCANDADCKGDRICVAGNCQAPARSAQPAQPASQPQPLVAEPAEPVAVAPLTPTAAPAPVPPPTFGGRSAAPTLAEWDGQTREVTVTGSSALACETKQVREWVRISCRPEGGSLGNPQSVAITRGQTSETFVFSTPGVVASLVFPFEPGRDITAEFVWQLGMRTFRSHWPRGAPEPQARGAFQ